MVYHLQAIDFRIEKSLKITVLRWLIYAISLFSGEGEKTKAKSAFRLHPEITKRRKDAKLRLFDSPRKNEKKQIVFFCGKVEKRKFVLFRGEVEKTQVCVFLLFLVEVKKTTNLRLFVI